MLKEIVIPNLGLTMVEAKVIDVLKKEGDSVENGETLLVIETDKASFDVNSFQKGILHITAKAGETYPVSTVVGWTAESLSEYEANLIMQNPVEKMRERVSNNDTEACKALNTGELKRDAKRLRLMGIRSTPAARRNAFERGIDLAGIKGSGIEGRIHEIDVLTAVKADIDTKEDKIHSTPLSRKIAEGEGIELNKIEGTGISGRIMKDDVINAIRSRENAVTTGVIVQDLEAKGIKEVIPIKGKRKIIFDRMKQSIRDSAQLTFMMEVDAGELVELRKALIEMYKKKSIRFSYNTIIVRILSHVLYEHPVFNSSVVGSEIYLWDKINIGIAMDMEDGLVVPVIRNVGNKDLIQLQSDMDILIEKMRTKRLLIDDIKDGTFTLSNLGLFDVEAFTPILNQPEVGILGIGKIVEKVVADHGQIKIGQRMMLSLTVDHRVIDGADAARFLRNIKECIENPIIIMAGRNP